MILNETVELPSYSKTTWDRVHRAVINVQRAYTDPTTNEKFLRPFDTLSPALQAMYITEAHKIALAVAIEFARGDV